MKTVLVLLVTCAQDDASRAITAYHRAFGTARDSAARAAAVGHLAVVHDSVLAELLKLVPHREADVRAAAARFLGDHRGSGKAAAALAGLAADADPTVAVRACEALGSMERDVARPHAAALNRLVGAKDDAVAKAAALAAGILRDTSSIRPLIEAQALVAQKLARLFQQMGVGGCDGG